MNPLRYRHVWKDALVAEPQDATDGGLTGIKSRNHARVFGRDQVGEHALRHVHADVLAQHRSHQPDEEHPHDFLLGGVPHDHLKAHDHQAPEDEPRPPLPPGRHGVVG